MEPGRERPRKGHGGGLISKVVTTLHSSQYSLHSVALQLLAGLRACFWPTEGGFANSAPVLSLDLQHVYSFSWNSERMPGEQTRTSCCRMRDHLEQS